MPILRPRNDPLCETLDIVNLTDDTIQIPVFPEAAGSSPSGSDDGENRFLAPRSSWPAKPYGVYAYRRIMPMWCQRHSQSHCWIIQFQGQSRPVTWRGKNGWEALRVTYGGEDPPWKFYRMKITRTHHRLVILPHRNVASFMAGLPPSLPLSSLLLPGTHDTLAFYGYPISQCQSPTTPLEVQLRSGIRLFDIRLSIVSGVLLAFHGATPQFTPFTTVLHILTEFLTSEDGRRETLVVSIKQEDGALGQLKLFSFLVHEGIVSDPRIRDTWFLENRIPTLGEARGKAILFSRFGGDGAEWEGGLEGIGIHPTTWPDSKKEGFFWLCRDTLVRTQDWYAIPSFLSIPEKFERSVRLLQPPSDEATAVERMVSLPRRSATSSVSSISSMDPEKPIPPPATLSITYFSAATFPLALPQTVALGFGYPEWNLGVEGVNVRLGRWLLEQFAGETVVPVSDTAQSTQSAGREVRLRAWAFLDFYEWPLLDWGVVPLLVECNFRGRRQGEEGWNQEHTQTDGS